VLLNNKKVIKKRSNIIKNIMKKMSNIISFIQINIIFLKNKILRLFKVNIFEKAIIKSSLLTRKEIIFILGTIVNCFFIIIVFIISPLESTCNDLSEFYSELPSEIPNEEFFEYWLEIPLDPSEVPLEGFFEYPLEIPLDPIKKLFFTSKAVDMDLFRHSSINDLTLKPLYKGFLEEIFKIRSYGDNGTETSLSPLTDITKVDSPNAYTEISPDYSKDLFSPATFKELDLLIKGNEDNLNNINNLPVDTKVKQNNYESLLEEREYLLHQKANHLRGVLQEASKIPTNDTDIDKLLKNIYDLESYAKSLRARAEAITSSKLNTINE